jgi:signal transduction histidine kinase
MLPDSRVRQRDFLLEISRALTQELDLDRVLGRILDIALDMLGGQAGLIALRTGNNGWHMRVSRGLPAIYLDQIAPYLAKVPLESNPEETEIPEINRWLNEFITAASMGFYSGVGIPLITRQHVVGVIFIFRAYLGVFSSNDRSLLRSFADQAAIAVQNALLYTQVFQETQRLNALLDTVADGILILSPDLKIDRVNPAFLNIICLPREKVLNQGHEDIIRWVNPPKEDTLEKSVMGGWPLTPDTTLYVEGDLRRDHRFAALPVSITYAPLISAEGQLLNIIADIRDITRFRQADELKSTFISIISHELKTPVALIKGYVSTLRREDARWDKKVVQESLKVIEEESDHLTNLIENLLDASRLQAGGLSIKRADCNLPEVVRRIAEKFRIQSPEHPVIVDFPPNFPVILADEMRIGQVVSNLISNAIKYAPVGDINISGQVLPDNIVVCIKDEGPGISPEDAPYIFDRFYRAPETAKKTKGTGLGLFLARSIIEAHGGRIWFDADTSKGTRICFTLPIQSLDNPSEPA